MKEGKGSGNEEKYLGRINMVDLADFLEEEDRCNYCTDGGRSNPDL